mmetsp:Transcript_20303/g.29474  ORF Transcript_20303/g.29474 Transcript_20303/m.29474 type:complete len:114 (+) Transcript_20303:16-357(+)
MWSFWSETLHIWESNGFSPGTGGEEGRHHHWQARQVAFSIRISSFRSILRLYSNICEARIFAGLEPKGNYPQRHTSENPRLPPRSFSFGHERRQSVLREQDSLHSSMKAGEEV